MKFGRICALGTGRGFTKKDDFRWIVAFGPGRKCTKNVGCDKIQPLEQEGDSAQKVDLDDFCSGNRKAIV